MGHRQAVRHRTLTPAVASSNLAGPVLRMREGLQNRGFCRLFWIKLKKMNEILVMKVGKEWLWYGKFELYN